MGDLLLESKLLVPQPHRDLVPRRRLTNIVDRASTCALTVVSAPPGFGKTTLLAQLAAGLDEQRGGHAVAWVSLDERDGEPRRFWSYVLHAVERASPGAAASALDLLDSAIGSLEGVIAALVNELSVHPGEVTLVLDDFHLVDDPAISDDLAFLLDHRPPQLHLVIGTRADPALPLARLRARGELVEVRAEDLRFSADEAGTYLNGIHGLDLSTADVASLEARTEGWIAALQLAAASLRDRDDKTAFISGFAGDDRFVVDYLADEVLDRQPAAVRRFLLETSVLERLSGPLCDAVTEQEDGGSTLVALERQNLLIVPLDDRRHWYRYHHLFADVLRSRLLTETSIDVSALHRRASAWFEQVGEMDAAVRHSVAAGDLVRAADLVEIAAPALRRQRSEGVIRGWIDVIPDEVVERRPVLAGIFIAALMADNAFGGVGKRLDDLEGVLAGPADAVVVRNRAEAERLPALIATQRAGLALVAGDLDLAISDAEGALAVAGTDDLLTLAAARALKGLASWAVGDLRSAYEAYTAAAHDLAAAGHVADVLGCTVTLVDLALTLGRLGDAQRLATEALGLARSATTSEVVRGTADMWVALGRVAWQYGDAVTSARHLDRAADLGEGAGLPQQPYRWRVAMADVRAAVGDWSGADALLEEAGRLYVGDFSPNVRPVGATRARLWVRAGDLAAARRWARERRLSPREDVTYVREYEQLTLARILLAEHALSEDRVTIADAMNLLERLREAADAGGRIGTTVEVAVLTARARHLAGDRAQALESLRLALALAQPEAWVRVIADEAVGLRGVLDELEGLDGDPQFLAEVRAAAGGSASSAGGPQRGGRTDSPRTGRAGPVDTPDPRLSYVEPLSERELEVMRLLGSDLDGPAIARELSVSLSTVRTHTQHIYTKLGVNNRRAAVRRAHQLDL
ncbi:LuxR C-terminal-related transcriptional regulator [Knoellia sp. 3-2P3]|uniref:LuxR C-terminal-related transcriptional regulator n=1 Tax=unclassified Knoellia TaxID=2618719 RepID=UPI0023D9DC44|nr:LuxR C-terminal-related transcriptional regulator [Knoellia sp. 3-2P3]MDF2092246.1 LuxR C-terminal-related transcriptional regulator [Knoellia sp. 3-2P3]